MEIKIVFTEPPYSELQISADQEDSQKTIFIKDPYTITKDENGRKIVGGDDKRITYEQYCIELQQIIAHTLQAEQLNKFPSCNAIIIEGCKEPPNFEALCSSLEKSKIPLSFPCDLTIRNCSFYGSLYVNSLGKFVKSVKASDPPILFNITLQEKQPTKLSEHDKAKLATLDKVAFFPDEQGAALIRRFRDDQLHPVQKNAHNFAIKIKAKAQDYPVERKKSFSYLTNPSYLFQRKRQVQRAFPQGLLLDFFSQAHQQQSDYTCGPAALKMVADYYFMMSKHDFCGEPLSQYDSSKEQSSQEGKVNQVWRRLNAQTEVELANRVKTTEEVGSDLRDMREGLIEFGLPVLDDADGLSNLEHDEIRLIEHKKMLFEKFKQVLNLGIPIIVNMRDQDDIGHYEVIIGIDEKGCDLYLMSELPKSSAQYKNSYLFLKKNDTQELYYIKPDGEYEKAKIDDFNLFEEKINAIKNKDGTKLHLSGEQIKEIVTSNGGHTHEKDTIILAEPGGSLGGHLDFEQLPKDKFIERWRNMSGEFHGRFLILPPNDASTNELEAIFDDVPHFLNNELKGPLQQIFSLK